MLLAGAALCNDASLERDREKSEHFHAMGDPSEGALVVAAAHQGLWKANLDRAFLAFSRMGLAETMRSERDSVFRLRLLSNKPLLAAVALTFGLQLAVIYVPFLQGVFKTTPLSGVELLVSLALSTVVFWAMELDKWLLQHR